MRHPKDIVSITRCGDKIIRREGFPLETLDEKLFRFITLAEVSYTPWLKTDAEKRRYLNKLKKNPVVQSKDDPAVEFERLKEIYLQQEMEALFEGVVRYTRSGDTLTISHRKPIW